MIHYGKELKKEIKDKGYCKSKIAEKLCISYNTLERRLKDGKFNVIQVGILKDNRYI